MPLVLGFRSLGLDAEANKPTVLLMYCTKAWNGSPTATAPPPRQWKAAFCFLSGIPRSILLLNSLTRVYFCGGKSQPSVFFIHLAVFPPRSVWDDRNENTKREWGRSDGGELGLRVQSSGNIRTMRRKGAFLAVSSHILNTFAVPTRSPSANIQPSPEIYSRNQPQRLFGWFYAVLENLECIFYRVHWLSITLRYIPRWAAVKLVSPKTFRVNRISDIDSYSPVHVSCPSLFAQRCRSISAKTTPRLLTRLWLFFTEPNRTAIKLRQRLFLPCIYSSFSPA